MPSNGKPFINKGAVFSRLTVLAFHHSDERWRRHYKCRCACGVVKVVQGSLLLAGNTKSCGCWASDHKRAQRLPNDRDIINQIILQARRHARTRGLCWNLSFKFVNAEVRKPCFYCGNTGGNIKRNRHNPNGFIYNGLDRVNNAVGYVRSNAVACCAQCNRSKGSMRISDFTVWALRLRQDGGTVGEFMKLTIAIIGVPNSGKSAVAGIIEAELTRLGCTVETDDETVREYDLNADIVANGKFIVSLKTVQEI